MRYLIIFLTFLSLQVNAHRVISITPDITDIIIALGGTEHLVARDLSSDQEAVRNIPSIGIFRQLTVEPIVTMKPNLVIGSWMAQPASIYDQLKSIGIDARNVMPSSSIEDYAQGIIAVGQLIGHGALDKSEALANSWQKGMQQMPQSATRILITYDGRLVAGQNTVADELIRQSGGINVAEHINGIKPLSREAWMSMNPDVIIIADHNEAALGGIDGFSKRLEIADTQAAKKSKIFFWPAVDIFSYQLKSPIILEKLHHLRD